MEPMDHHTLRDFLTNHPLLDGQSTGTHDYIHFRHLFWEHLVNRARAVAEDLTPLRTFEYGVPVAELLPEGRVPSGSEPATKIVKRFCTGAM